MATATYGALPEISKAARTCGSQAFNRQKLRSVGQFLYPLLETYSSISPSCSGQESDKLAPESPQIPSTGMAAPKSRRTSPGRGNRWSFGPPPSGRPVSGSLPWKDTTSSEEPATPSADGEDTVISSPGGEPQIWHRGCALEISSPKGPKTCAQCGSSKTPLWRNGPPGPKSLCNACGIRYNKMKAGKRSRAPTNEEILMAPSSPVPVQKPVAAPLFASRMMGKARDAAMEASFLHWQHASRGSLEQMPRKRSRTLHHPRIMLGATKLECREEGNGSDDEASRKNADMSRSSNGSSSGDSCITAKGRRTISPTWTSRSPEQQAEIPPLCLNSHATPAKGFTGKPFGDDTEGAELLMVLFYGADKWQSKVLPAMLTA